MGPRPGSTKLPGQLLGSPVVDRHGHVYVGVSQAERGQPLKGFLVCVDGNSHKVRWQYPAAGPIESTPVIGDDDMLYFGDNSGKIHALDDRGTAQWTAQVESAVRSPGTIVAPERPWPSDWTTTRWSCSAARPKVWLPPAGPSSGVPGQTGPV